MKVPRGGLEERLSVSRVSSLSIWRRLGLQLEHLEAVGGMVLYRETSNLQDVWRPQGVLSSS